MKDKTEKAVKINHQHRRKKLSDQWMRCPEAHACVRWPLFVIQSFSRFVF
jgi:hypothetical protein